MKCPVCARENKNGTTWKEMATYGMSAVDSFTDDEGNVHAHDPVEVQEEWSCENDHSFMVYYLAGCPVKGCNYGKETLRIE